VKNSIFLRRYRTGDHSHCSHGGRVTAPLHTGRHPAETKLKILAYEDLRGTQARVLQGHEVWSGLLQETSTPALDFDTHQDYMVKQVSMRVTARAYYLNSYCEPLQVENY
jgi:hypothetical protein